ncbi:N-acetylmuramoyl-L-alanine amidase [Paenibacillus sp. 1P07SE]|uniref:N-acetylmuramoyl-L-alanine amidase n=1 Tax=Paenibacillus sp. 1P07SE TaxID=3132209 RepID=UPI0039A7055F
MMFGVLLLSAVASLLLVQPGEALASGQYYAKVNATSLNVREDAAKDAEVKGSVKGGEIVLVTREFHGWYYVKHGSLEGWVAGYYLLQTDNKPGSVSTASADKSSGSGSRSSADASVVLADALRVREGPGTDYKINGMLYRGAAVSIQESVKGWLHVVSGGERGWVSSQYVGDGEQITVSPGQRSAGSGSGSLRGKVIVIDPGHGGSDPGMIGTTYKTAEKTINLSTANYLKDKLQALGATVVMTRTKDDQKPELPRRVAISHEAGADAFISIHYNSSERNNSGILSFFYSSKKDRPLAHAIERQLAGGIGLKSHGVAFGDYHVLRENRTPAVLLELGFLSNKRDEGIVRTSDYQRKAADAIAVGLQNYFK